MSVRKLSIPGAEAPTQSVRIMGIDPGSQRTGVGIIDIDAVGRTQHVFHTAVVLLDNETFPLRLKQIFDDLRADHRRASPRRSRDRARVHGAQRRLRAQARAGARRGDLRGGQPGAFRRRVFGEGDQAIRRRRRRRREAPGTAHGGYTFEHRARNCRPTPPMRSRSRSRTRTRVRACSASAWTLSAAAVLHGGGHRRGRAGRRHDRTGSGGFSLRSSRPGC